MYYVDLYNIIMMSFSNIIPVIYIGSWLQLISYSLSAEMSNLGRWIQQIFK